jgi:hypothetical protein
MEATGVYWKPVWHILDDGEFVLVLANAAHVKNVPGRKTDVNDAMWLAELLAHGLIRASFVPDTQTQEMRNLLRTRKQLVREQSSHVLRVQKTLEDANIKLDSVLTDLMGKSGRAMLEALIAGETNPVGLASLADRRAKASPDSPAKRDYQNFCVKPVIRHEFTNRSLNMTANCVFAWAHSRGGRFHSAVARFKTKYSSLVAASSEGKCPLVRTARRSFELSASMAFVV